MKLIIFISIALAGCVTAEILKTARKVNTKNSLRQIIDPFACQPVMLQPWGHDCHWSNFVNAYLCNCNTLKTTAKKSEATKGLRQILDQFTCRPVNIYPIGNNCRWSNFVQAYMCDCPE